MHACTRMHTYTNTEGVVVLPSCSTAVMPPPPKKGYLQLALLHRYAREDYQLPICFLCAALSSPPVCSDAMLRYWHLTSGRHVSWGRQRHSARRLQRAKTRPPSMLCGAVSLRGRPLTAARHRCLRGHTLTQPTTRWRATCWTAGSVATASLMRFFCNGHQQMQRCGQTDRQTCLLPIPFLLPLLTRGNPGLIDRTWAPFHVLVKLACSNTETHV
jgi:hypothetical protein